MGASRPAALTHSPTPGSKKCAVLSKGFWRLQETRFIAQIIQVVETAAYRRMLVRLQLERLSFVSEMIYLTVELNFHKTIILYMMVKSRLIGLKSMKSCAK